MSLLDDKNVYYLGNQKLKKVNVPVNFTKKQIMEFGKCANDPIYFIKKYVKIVNPNKGLTSFGLWPFQEKMAEMFVENRFTVCKIPRQSGKTQTVVAVLLWYVLFHQNYTIAVLAHKASQSREILSRLQFSYEHLPKWLQQGIVEWSKGTVILENGSKIETSATSGNSVRGKTYNCVTGDSLIIIKFNEKVFNLTINELNLLLRMNSKSINTQDIFCKEVNYDIFEKQIHEMVLSNSRLPIEKSIVKNNRSEIFNRISSYSSKMFGWNGYSRECIKFNNQGTLNTTSSIAKNDRQKYKGIFLTDIGIYQNGIGSPGNVSKFYGNNEKNLHRRIIHSPERKNDWEETFGSNQRKNEIALTWESDGRFYENEIIEYFKRKWSRYSENRGTQRKNIHSFEWKEENARTLYENKSESRENSENRRETSRYETIRGIEKENERKRKTALPKIEILTREGFKSFHGVRNVGEREILELSINDIKIKCTPDHKILTSIGWLDAKECLHEEIFTNSGYQTCNSINSKNEENVFDILHVEDVNEFYCNGVAVHNCVYLDEFAFVPNNIQTEFFATVMPTISAGEETKMIITSTPNGMNMFHKIWNEAVAGENSFKPIGVHWSEIPGRDEKWKEETIKNSSILQFNQEFGCEFLGSQNTLISAAKLEQMYTAKPVRQNEDMKIYIDPSKKEHRGKLYIMVVDTSRGVGGDYNAFVIFDVSEIPYKVVGQYKNNTISPLMFPNIIHQFAKSFNDAYICVEINDNGQQVADILYREMEYENMVFSYMRGNMGQQLSSGFGGRPTVGIRTTKLVKRIGCTNFKTLVENDKLLIPDIDIKKELYNFIEVGESFEAAEGHHDDLSMCCVLFSWLVQQPYFKDWTDTNVRERMVTDNLKLLDEDVLPIFTEDDSYLYDQHEIRDISYNEFMRFLTED
jgi:hypothetical protein